jgi:hypothetical protein
MNEGEAELFTSEVLSHFMQASQTLRIVATRREDDAGYALNFSWLFDVSRVASYWRLAFVLVVAWRARLMRV